MNHRRNPDVYTWGRSARLRAHRDYLGLGTEEMADKLGMARRSYMRIERGQAAVPPGLWDTVDSVLADFHTAVDEMASRADDNDVDVEIPVPRDMDAWTRSIVAMAMHHSRLVPMTSDDYDARTELQPEETSR